ncbi:hypothetical protein NYE69_25915 [Paenibacillus sp. FSL R5-0527]|uniref:hypothetical protein n=1 Tax=Paenibacillus sp. FSL R5-0527 TaxID=2975321 RepID=UPI00097BA211|nr:hypothetical protein BK140_10035 [Paenibacillus macerans]
MADKEIYELEIEIENRDVDKTQKKLRSLDKLLQQTQRRAGLLGKTRIKPAVTLDDRFSSAARKIGDTLTRLHRTTVKPVAELDDRASKAAVKLYATLAALSAPRWRVSVAGVDWETAVGDSFMKWISSDGKSTMQRISASIASALGGGLKDVMMQALGLGDAVKASGTRNSGGSSRKPKKSSDLGVSGEGASSLLSPSLTDIIIKEGNNKSNNTAKQPGFSEESDTNPFTASLPDFMKKWDFNKTRRPGFYEDGYYDVLSFLKDGLKDKAQATAPKSLESTPNIPVTGIKSGYSGSIYAEAGLRAGEAFFQAFLSVLDSNQIGEKLGGVSFSPVAETDKKLAKWEEETINIFKSVATSLFSSWLWGKLNKWNGSLSKYLITDLSKVPKPVAGLASGATKGLGEAMGPLGTILLLNDGYNISAELTDFVLGHKAGDRKYRNPLFGFPEDYYTDSVSPFGWKEFWNHPAVQSIVKPEPLSSSSFKPSWNFNEYKKVWTKAWNDLWGFSSSNQEEPLNNLGTQLNTKGSLLAPSVGGTMSPDKESRRIMGTSVPDAVLPPFASNQINSPEKTYSKENTGYQINVSVAQGALNLTVNKDEINYDELAQKAGWKIANEVRFAMQNLK